MSRFLSASSDDAQFLRCELCEVAPAKDELVVKSAATGGAVWHPNCRPFWWSPAMASGYDDQAPAVRAALDAANAERKRVRDDDIAEKRRLSALEAEEKRVKKVRCGCAAAASSRWRAQPIGRPRDLARPPARAPFRPPTRLPACSPQVKEEAAELAEEERAAGKPKSKRAKKG